jgi:asparagine synthase (glutamine-hydrolysing)
MGIYGVVTRVDGAPIGEPELRAMGSSLGAVAKRAPFRAAAGIGLGTTRDSVSGSFWSSDELTVACDAELYNSERPRGCGAASWIADLYRAQGISLVERLRGDFSIAIWDARAEQLFLAVDRFGVKRLCYAERHSEIVFATQPRGVFASGRVARLVDLSAITDYLVYNVVPIPRAAFSGLCYVPPGCYLKWTKKGSTATRYWNMQYPEDLKGTERFQAESLLERMKDSVRIASSDLNFTKSGCFLSGGTDSSSIIGLVTQDSKNPVNAFSIGFSDERFNELEYADVAVNHFRANHFKTYLGPEEASAVIRKIVAAYDEPFGNASAVPSYWCAKLAHEHGMEVLLAGDGGDELFGGNDRYAKNQLFQSYQRIPGPLRRWLIEPLVAYSPVRPGILTKAENYIRRANTGNPDRYCQWRLLRVFAPEFVLGGDMPFRNGHSDLLTTARAHYKEAPAKSELNRLLYLDVKMTLGDDDLPKVTRMAELAGVRVRFPYLDHPLAEFSGRLRADLKVRGMEKRYLFKQATRELLPQAILKKKKHGFGLPIGMWLKTEARMRAWATEILFDPRTYQRGYFRREFIEHLFERMKRDGTPYFGDLLYVFVMLELWHRQHVEGSAW